MFIEFYGKGQIFLIARGMLPCSQNTMWRLVIGIFCLGLSWLELCVKLCRTESSCWYIDMKIGATIPQDLRLLHSLQPFDGQHMKTLTRLSTVSTWSIVHPTMNSDADLSDLFKKWVSTNLSLEMDHKTPASHLTIRTASKTFLEIPGQTGLLDATSTMGVACCTMKEQLEVLGALMQVSFTWCVAARFVIVLFMTWSWHVSSQGQSLQQP